MDIRRITSRYHVAPQLVPENLAAIADAGFKTVICNRPDAEVPQDQQAAAIRAAAQDAGLGFETLELTHQTMTPENVARQRELIDGSDGPVLAYCATGTRCSVVWALGQAETMPVDEILATTARAGYDLEGLRPTLEQLSRVSG
ncbi:TIGR01244 family sulfur transferase [Pontibaca salina]|uniref:TIGR01244 family phosphatase n=1 Tax=Pontibaca salina TaxID=2795731 RepID=A0A934HQB3_9RHOB|nr:TIGR01244 family sulfur transferase [Pontibaca salina]MBI6628635.1 TIGR01244 family phosphatase [Pontibaca salina]